MVKCPKGRKKENFLHENLMLAIVSLASLYYFINTTRFCGESLSYLTLLTDKFSFYSLQSI